MVLLRTLFAQVQRKEVFCPGSKDCCSVRCTSLTASKPRHWEGNFSCEQIRFMLLLYKRVSHKKIRWAVKISFFSSYLSLH